MLQRISSVLSIFILSLILISCENSTGSQSKNAEILDFGIEELPELHFSINNFSKIISLENFEDLDPETDISNLTALVKLSDGATAFVGDSLQLYGESVNDFRGGLTYTVISENGGTKNEYFVHLEEETPIKYLVEGFMGVELDPYGNAPLSAIANFQTKKPAQVRIEITGDEKVSKTFSEYKTHHAIPVLGLYPDKRNEVAITLTDQNGVMVSDTLFIQTAPLPDFFPDIDINVLGSGMEPGFHFNDFHIGNAGNFNSYPLIFDNNGDVRWYMDFSKFDKIVWPIQFNGDGTFFAIFGVTIFEFDMTGKELKRIVVEENNMHHEVIKLSNGNYIVAVSRVGTTMIKNGEESISVEDYIIEVDPSGSIVTEWDMAEILDVNRIDLVDGGADWFHMNAIWYDGADHSLIISGRNQGLIKVNWENELQWILAPHKGWGTSGRTGEGAETAPFLLTAVNSSGEPFSNDVQQGDIEVDVFSWPWGQHAPLILPNGNLLVFDNGYNRNFGAASNYSMATEYRIDEENMTVEQVWSYGKERGSETYSNIISDVDYLPQTGHRLFMPGITPDAASKIIEVNENNDVIFESTMNFKNMLGNQQGWGNIDITYRAGRVPLYW